MQSIELRARRTTARVIWVNLISVLINILLAVSAFYFAFINDSSATGAFAADCVLDFVSSAIVLWRYFGDLTSEFAHIREQIACLYLGGLFQISAFAIIVKALMDILAGDPGDSRPERGYYKQAADGSSELVYLASAATLACLILSLFKWGLYRELKDNSILLDVVNTLISSVFAISIVMSQLLISIDNSFWYLDPVLSIVLAVFMMAFGMKVIHQNYGLFKRHQHYEQTHIFDEDDADHNSPGQRRHSSLNNNNNNNHHFYNSKHDYLTSSNYYHHNTQFTASYDNHVHILHGSHQKRAPQLLSSGHHTNDEPSNQSERLLKTSQDTNNNNYIDNIQDNNFKRSNYGTNLSLSMERGDFWLNNSDGQQTRTTNNPRLTTFHHQSANYPRRPPQLAPNSPGGGGGCWLKDHYPNIVIR